MRAPDLIALAQQYEKLSSYSNHNIWLHKLLLEMGKLPNDEYVPFSKLLEMTLMSGPVGSTKMQAMEIARHVEDIYRRKFPTMRSYAYGLCVCIKEKMEPHASVSDVQGI